jgi:hypothetical protein
LSKDQLAAMQYGVSADTRVPLSEHFSKRYGEARWRAVLDEIENPIMTAEDFSYFLEVHPSQGRILQEEGADLGIVVGGIGGMQNREVIIPVSSVRSCTVATSGGLGRFEIQIIGQADHTGSALHNLPDSSSSATRNRVDALLGARELLTRLNGRIPPGRASKDSVLWGVARTRPGAPTGFTTVPHDQRIEIVADPKSAATLITTIESIATELKSMGLAVAVRELPSSEPGAQSVIDHAQLLSALEIPLTVERIAARLAADDESGALGEMSSRCRGGLVRGTVTDFDFSASGGISFKVNLRRGEKQLGERLVAEVASALASSVLHTFGVALEAVATIMSEYAPSPVDEAGVRELTEIAASLGYKVLHTPSMPAHDVGRLMSDGARIPGNLLFLTDEGGSHVPTEQVRPEHLSKGLEVAHLYLARKIGVTLG